MIEPINTPDAPGYGARSMRDALPLRNEVAGFGLPPIGILLDVYRLALDQQGIEEAIVESGEAISHVQVADARADMSRAPVRSISRLLSGG